jgi:PPOX class probable F420-dependent enzyme
MPNINAHVEQRLRNDPIVWLITVRPDGRPHVVPVWFFWDGETFLIMSQPNKQKLHNLRQNPNVSLALDGTGNLGEDVIVVEGTAALLNESSLSLLSAFPAIAEKYAFLLKSMNQDMQSLAAEYSQPIRVTPTRFLFG